MNNTREPKKAAPTGGLTPEGQGRETAPGALRLQVYLARAGAASRRASEQLIAQGRVTVNGQVVSVPGVKVGEGDEVRLDGLLYICSASDPQGRALARELPPPELGERLYTVGRLDYRSSGLIFFTNDGDFSARVGHPRAGIEKEYLVEAAGPVPEPVLEAFRRGVEVEGVLYRAEAVERLGRRSLRVVLIEGKNREIRRVFSHFHLHPLILRRIRIGPVLLGDLAEGQSRPLTGEELRNLGAKEDGHGHSD